MGELIAYAVAIVGAYVVADIIVSVMICDKDNPFFFEAFTLKKRLNTLYRCSEKDCKLISREYQHELYYLRHGEHNCPHCENTIRKHYGLIEEEEWMNHHKDCIKLSFLESVKMGFTMRKLVKQNKQLASMKFYEEYNNLSVNFDWIENLSKKKKENS